MEAESTQLVIGGAQEAFQKRLAAAISSCQDENHEVELHFSTCQGQNGGYHYSALVIGRSRDYWRDIGGT